MISPFNWIRDLLGIHKDHLDKEKTKREIKKLDEEISSQLITRATFQDVQHYDPKYKQIRGKQDWPPEHRHHEPDDRELRRARSGGCLVSIGIILTIIMLLVVLVSF